MSDAPGSGSVAAERLPTTLRMLRAVGRAIRAFPYALVVSVMLSGALVVLVGLLIAFMQYQGRLMRAQTTLTAPAIVQIVSSYRNMQQRFYELASISNELAKLTSEHASIENEIRFRINRVCTLFRFDPDKFKACRDYLGSVPFPSVDPPPAVPPSPAGTLSWIWPFSRGETDTSKIHDRWKLQSESVRERFVEIMGGRGTGIAGSTLEKIVELYAWDMEEIAKKNLQYWLKTRPSYDYTFAQFEAVCGDIVNFAADVKAYQKVNVVFCQNPVKLSPLNFEISVEAPAGEFLNPTNASAIDRVASPSEARIGNEAPPSPGAARTTGQRSPGMSNSTAPLPGTDAAGPPDAKQVETEGQVTFELVSNYLFYASLLFGLSNDILVSPGDFLALALVCFAGMLGALLRVVFFSYVSGRDPSARNIFIGPILGLICALVVYIIFRAGFIVIADRGSGSGEATLSPFVIAIMSMSAGLLSERAIDLLRHTSGAWLGSAEASQASRWAMRLKQEVELRGLTLEGLAARLDVSPIKMEDWAAEKELVPIDKQRDIALVLDMPVRLLFTDLSPQSGRTI